MSVLVIMCLTLLVIMFVMLAVVVILLIWLPSILALGIFSGLGRIGFAGEAPVGAISTGACSPDFYRSQEGL